MRLERITAEELAVFLPHLEKDYAQELSANMNIPLEEALQRSHKQIGELLPQGAGTPNHLIWVIRQEDADVKKSPTSEAEPAGYLWVFTDMPKRSAFIYDIEIAEALRGRGLGKAALLKLEELMLEIGIDKIGLHVFGDNTVAQHLYQSLGYEVSSINMQKRLSGKPQGASIPVDNKTSV